jgi:two-component system chemotaxis sensor kinase CheA
MPITSEIREQIISTFRAELAEHTQAISNGLLVLEKSLQNSADRQALLQEVFRSAHSLKGAARAVGVTAVEQLGHGLENVLSDIQKQVIVPGHDLYTVCYKALDAIQSAETAYEAGNDAPILQAMQTLAELEAQRAACRVSASQPALESGAQPSKVEAAPDLPAEGSETGQVSSSGADLTPNSKNAPSLPAGQSAGLGETIRVRVEKLDSVNNQLSELLMAKTHLDQRRGQITQLQSALALWQKEWGNPSSQSFLKDINKKVNELSRDYSNDVIHVSMAVAALEREVRQIRLLPLSTITGTFERMVRDLATSAKKDVVFEIVGAKLEMDKHVLELVKDPLLHLLRNAIDHGIELPAERVRMKKPAAGKITLSAEQQGKDMLLRVWDDGRGLDMQAIRNAISQRSGTMANDHELSESELVEWIFIAGVSTSPMITDVSGRGIGLNVVQKNIEILQGHVNVSSVPDAGTSFTLTIPMTMTSSRVLLVEAASHSFALPLNSVERILQIGQEKVSSVAGEQVLNEKDRAIPLVWLKNILSLPEPEQKPAASELSSAIILRSADRHLAIIVDDLLGEQEIVMKALSKPLIKVGGIAGTTILASGKVVLVLNVADLIKLASRGHSHGARPDLHAQFATPKQSRAKKRILVVDDSITTRTLEKNILEAEGFIVQVATDGREALSVIAASGLPDLVISDINMPHMDGFEFTSRIKSDPQTSAVPVFLVSSLDSSEDKAHGIQVGADAYIVKSRFDQTNLLELIQQVIG